jgi:hypothetical protein
MIDKIITLLYNDIADKRKRQNKKRRYKKMKGVRFNYLNGLQWKFFSTKKAFLEWARNTENNGVYYISYPNMTSKLSREQVLEIFKR